VGRQSRNMGKYINNMFPHLMRDINLVVYTEPWAVQAVLRVREQAGYANKTHVIPLATNSAYLGFYDLLPEMQRIGARNYLVNWYHGTDTAWKVVGRYAWITHEKFSFVRHAVKENVFNSRYFFWMDAGGGYGHTNVTLHACPCNIAVPGTATFFHRHASNTDLFEKGLVDPWDTKITPPLTEITVDRYIREFWRTTRFNSIMGTFWGGDAEGIMHLWKDYNSTVRILVKAGRIDTEQGVMPLIAAQRNNYLMFVPMSGFDRVNDIA